MASAISPTDNIAILEAYRTPGVRVFSRESGDWFEHKPHDDCDCYAQMFHVYAEEG